MVSLPSRRLGVGVACLLAFFALRLTAATVPTGFTESVVASGLLAPTTMQFAPDGRLFVLEQAGRVRVVQNGVLLATPFLTLQVDNNGERGLLGIAFDPDFATTPWVYLYYTVPGAAPGGASHNRVIRVEGSGNVATGSPLTVYDLDDLDDQVPPFHNGGAMAFGPDDMLYVGVGESMRPQLAQDMTSRFGKMLRITRDGAIPTDNPFYATATGDNRAIWALGLRNPNNFAFNPGQTPGMLINDVGQSRWEEVNLGVAGANYGWPLAEGPDETGSPNPAFTYPLYSYFHSQGCAIVGGAFYAPATATFPASYLNSYFFADYCGREVGPEPNSWIGAINPAAPPVTDQNSRPQFADGLTAPVDVRVGPDGALYFLERPSGSAGAVYRIQYGSGAVPGITTHPADVTVAIGQQASFTVEANGTALTYQWQRDRADIAGATSASYAFTVQPGDTGRRFRVRVTNSGGTATSNEALLTVSANQAPVAMITLPAAAATYGGGQTITYAATATDAEDGVLPGSAFTWRVDFHHDAHVHPFLPDTAGATGGTFAIPTSGHTETTVWYRIHVTVADSAGVTHSVFRDVVPRVVQLTLTSLPAGRPLLLDSQPITAPHVTPSVEGVIRTIEAQNHTAGGVTYTFTGWSDGGAARHDVTTPATSTTYTATFATPPGITTHPANQTVAIGQQASFAVVASGAGLTYQWQRDQADIAGATGASYAFAAQDGDSGRRFRVRVTNSGGATTSNEALLTVSANQAPVATITQPVAGATYGGGQTIAYAGSGADPEDGALPGSAYSWRVELHHDAHVHPLLPATSGASGTFVIPTTGHTETTVWYRIHLTVADSAGTTHSVYRDIVPRVVQLTLASLPTGRPLLLDSQPVVTPYITSSVEGMIRNIEAQNHTDVSGAFIFTGWSDGGATRHDIATPTTDTTYTATFGATAAAPTAFALAANGGTLTASWNRVGGATSYQLEIGTAPGLSNLLDLDIGDLAFIQGVVPPGTYFGRVRGVQPVGVSPSSTEASAEVTSVAVCATPPPVPANYVARAGGLTAALTWLPAAAATSYLLEVGSTSGAADVLITNLGAVTSFVATAPAGNYFTRVRAVNACGGSAPSVEAALVLGCAPDSVVPSGLTASNASGVATFGWQAPLGATGYHLLVGTAPGVTNVLNASIGTATSLAVPLAGVPAGTYYVRVAATSACGIGLPSNEVLLTVP